MKNLVKSLDNPKDPSVGLLLDAWILKIHVRTPCTLQGRGPVSILVLRTLPILTVYISVPNFLKVSDRK